MTLRMRGWRRWLLALAGLLVLIGVGYGALAASTARSQLARAVLWGESDRHDYAPQDRGGPTRIKFHHPPSGKASAMPATVANLTCGTVVDELEPPGCDRGER